MTDPGPTPRPNPSVAHTGPIHPGTSRQEEQLIALKGETPHLPPTVGTPFFQSFFFGPFAGQPSEGAPERSGPRAWVLLCIFISILGYFMLWGFLKP